MSSSEYSEWAAFHSIDPIGEERADIRQGITSAILANANKGKGGTNREPSDFVLSRKHAPGQKSPQQMEAVFAQFARMHNKMNAQKRQKA